MVYIPNPREDTINFVAGRVGLDPASDDFDLGSAIDSWADSLPVAELVELDDSQRAERGVQLDISKDFQDIARVVSHLGNEISATAARVCMEGEIWGLRFIFNNTPEGILGATRWVRDGALGCPAIMKLVDENVEEDFRNQFTLLAGTAHSDERAEGGSIQVVPGALNVAAWPEDREQRKPTVSK